MKTTNSPEVPFLGDDQPKENPHEQDKLGYAPFAKRIAQTIIRMRAPNGYVIGLHGKWGSGKSTALNFVKHHILKHNEETNDPKLKITIVDFRPWIVAGHQDLIAAFFKIMAESLGNPDPWYKRWPKTALRIVKFGSDPLIDAVAKLGGSIDPSGGAASGASVGLLRGIVGFFTNRFLSEPSLQKTYENLREQLKTDGRRFVATIDDLDRLQDDEVRAIMQMVKTVGRLPNLVYILVYDREIVGRSLDGSNSDRMSPSFAEKIVQQELELPNPSRTALLKMLDQEVEFIAGIIPSSPRWSFINMDGIHRWIRGPRDVVRYANALKFSWPALQGEFDPIDLFAIEGLKLFEPGVFNWIRDHRDFFFSEGQFSYPAEDQIAFTMNLLKRRVSEDRLASLLSLLGVMFPESLKQLQGSDAFSSGEPYADVQARRGIGSAKGFDTYFSLHVPADIIPRSAVLALLDALHDEATIQRIIKGYIGRRTPSGASAIGELLEEIQFRFRGRQRIKSTQALLNALLLSGEEILRHNDHQSIMQLPPSAKFSFLIDDILNGWSLEEAGQHLLTAFELTTSPIVLADVWIDRGRELDIFERGGRTSHPPRVTREAFDQMGTIVLQRIEAAAEDGTLGDAPVYFDIIRAWTYLAGPHAPKTWIEGQMFESAEFLIKLGKGMVSYSTGTNRRSYALQQNPDPSVFDFLKLRDAAQQHMNNEGLSPDERALLKELAKGSNRALQGLPPLSFPGADDDDDV